MRFGHVRTAEEQLFSETQLHGEKLEGMMTNAKCIVAQATTSGNAWYWARNEIDRLSTCVQEVTSVLSLYQAHCKPPNTLASLQKKTDGA